MMGGYSVGTWRSSARWARMLRTALGPSIAAWPEDLEDVAEVMLNPDGRSWIDRLAEGLAPTGERLTAVDGERIIRLVAHHVGAECTPPHPGCQPSCPKPGRDLKVYCRRWSSRRHSPFAKPP